MFLNNVKIAGIINKLQIVKKGEIIHPIPIAPPFSLIIEIFSGSKYKFEITTIEASITFKIFKFIVYKF
jgi:hypothetical protein